MKTPAKINTLGSLISHLKARPTAGGRVTLKSADGTTAALIGLAVTDQQAILMTERGQQIYVPIAKLKPRAAK